MFAFCVSLPGLIQRCVVFCVHLAFLTDEVKHTQMQNPYNAQNVSVMLEQILIFRSSIRAE